MNLKKSADKVEVLSSNLSTPTSLKSNRFFGLDTAHRDVSRETLDGAPSIALHSTVGAASSRSLLACPCSRPRSSNRSGSRQMNRSHSRRSVRF